MSVDDPRPSIDDRLKAMFAEDEAWIADATKRLLRASRHAPANESDVPNPTGLIVPANKTVQVAYPPVIGKIGPTETRYSEVAGDCSVILDDLAHVYATLFSGLTTLSIALDPPVAEQEQLFLHRLDTGPALPIDAIRLTESHRLEITPAFPPGCTAYFLISEESDNPFCPPFQIFLVRRPERIDDRARDQLAESGYLAEAFALALSHEWPTPRDRALFYRNAFGRMAELIHELAKEVPLSHEDRLASEINTAVNRAYAVQRVLQEQFALGTP